MTPLVEKSESTLTIHASNVSITLPLYAEESVKAIMSGQPIRVADMPGTLDLEGKLFLARRMIKEGLLRMVDLD